MSGLWLGLRDAGLGALAAECRGWLRAAGVRRVIPRSVRQPHPQPGVVPVVVVLDRDLSLLSVTITIRIEDIIIMIIVKLLCLLDVTWPPPGTTWSLGSPLGSAGKLVLSQSELLQLK